MPSVSETAARIRAAHYYANLRQDDLAEALGVGVSTVARIEAGRKEATREQVETFVQQLADWAEKDRDALLCQLNSYVHPKQEVVA